MNCKYCNKQCKSKQALINHERLCKQNPKRQIPNLVNARKAALKKISCKHCNKLYSKTNIKKHETACKCNPNNIKICPVCETKYSKNSKTCSYACANTLFRSGTNNGNWKDSSYRSTCFKYHKKECIICGENKIVTVHHFDENRNNNNPENLIPLCPTHHHYCHSRYKYEIENMILEYIKNFKLSVDW